LEIIFGRYFGADHWLLVPDQRFIELHEKPREFGLLQLGLVDMPLVVEAGAIDVDAVGNDREIFDLAFGKIGLLALDGAPRLVEPGLFQEGEEARVFLADALAEIDDAASGDDAIALGPAMGISRDPHPILPLFFVRRL